VSFNDIVKITP